MNKIEKQEYVRKVLGEAMEEQKPKLELWETKKRMEIYDRLQNIYARTITEGVPTIEDGDEKLMDRIVK